MTVHLAYENETPAFLLDAPVLHRNFTGREHFNNPQGRRYFSLILTPEQAEVLKNDGWKVKYSDEDPFIKVVIPPDFNWRNLTLNGEHFYFGDSLEELQEVPNLRGDAAVRRQGLTVRGITYQINHLASVNFTSNN